MLRFKSKDPLINGFWKMKYIRIIKFEKGFFVCNRDNELLTKTLLNTPLDEEKLNFVPVLNLRTKLRKK
jgi:hypothetical protein